jgi:hypothetical protein
MKATILKDGTLKVVPENETEAYALRCWGEKKDVPSVLHVAYDEIEPPRGGEVANA